MRVIEYAQENDDVEKNTHAENWIAHKLVKMSVSTYVNLNMRIQKKYVKLRLFIHLFGSTVWLKDFF